MQKKLIVLSFLIVAAVGGSIAYVALRPEVTPSASSTNQTSQPASEQEQTTTNNSVQPAGKYENYQADKVAETTGTRILFFHAPWCPQCRQLDASIRAGTIPSGVTIFKVDYDSNQALRQQHGVTIQTTLIKLDDSGNAASKFVAYNDPSLSAVVKELL